MKRLPLTLLLFLLSSLNASAEVYQKQSDFISYAFSSSPKAQALWVTGELKAATTKILQHKPSFLRVKYWREGSRTAWVLQEIGKTEQITIGVVIAEQKIERIRVLQFRESRGWEVKHSFFTNQFIDATLNDENHLNKTIANVTGATLSTRAMRKVAKLALLFDNHVQQKEPTY